MTITQRLAEIAAEVQEIDLDVAKKLARRQGLKAEEAALLSGQSTAELSDLPRTEAIVAVLRSSVDSLSPTEIQRRLHEEGRSDELRSVTATLNHLMGRGLVQRPGHGTYLVV